jgi:hypothetical protein
MVPVNRSNVLEQRFINGVSLRTHRVDRPLQVDRVPQDNRRDNQIKAACTMTLEFVVLLCYKKCDNPRIKMDVMEVT